MNALAETCPPLEDIAAFLDHKMAGEERDRFMAHLVGCEECYPVFADSARFLLEEKEEEDEEGSHQKEPKPAEAAPPVAPVVPLQRKGAPRWALPLAAVLVLGLATIPLYFQASRKPEMFSAELVDPAALQNVPTESVWNQDKRGEPDPGALDQSLEFLVGVHLVDLSFTLARGDKEETMNVLARINGHMKGLLFVTEQARFYEKAVADLDQGRRTLTEVAAEAERVEAELTESYEEFPHLAFGKWAEAGRLSAKAKNPAFFEDRDNRRFPGWLLRNAEEDLGEEIAPRVKRIRGILDDEDPSKLPYEDLEKQFEDILQHYQHEADAASID